MSKVLVLVISIYLLQEERGGAGLSAWGTASHAMGCDWMAKGNTLWSFYNKTVLLWHSINVVVVKILALKCNCCYSFWIRSKKYCFLTHLNYLAMSFLNVWKRCFMTLMTCAHSVCSEPTRGEQQAWSSTTAPWSEPGETQHPGLEGKAKHHNASHVYACTPPSAVFITTCHCRPNHRSTINTQAWSMTWWKTVTSYIYNACSGTTHCITSILSP